MNTDQIALAAAFCLCLAALPAPATLTTPGRPGTWPERPAPWRHDALLHLAPADNPEHRGLAAVFVELAEAGALEDPEAAMARVGTEDAEAQRSH